MPKLKGPATKKPGRPPKVAPPVIPPISDPDSEVLSEKEADSIVEEKIEEKEKAVLKLEAELDSQDWSTADPVIPEALKDVVWVAVYRCPEAHKTKATNRQAKSGVRCWKCKGLGKTVKAEIMPQFLEAPPSGDPDVEKRRKARRGAE